MENLYSRNGLVFWTEEEIRVRDMIAQHLVRAVTRNLKSQNRAFEFFQVEAPLLTPRDLINANYTEEDMFLPLPDLALRTETTMGSYAYASWLLGTHQKVRLPFCVWQHGKSF